MGQLLGSINDRDNADEALTDLTKNKVKSERRDKKEKAIARLTNYGALDLANFGCNHLPKKIVQILEDIIFDATNGGTKLRVKDITLFGNKFTELPMDILLKLHVSGALSELKVVDLSFNRLEGSLPEELGPIFATVQRFMLLGNRITRLPLSIQSATNLVYVDLRENIIDVDTIIVRQWTNLKTLRLAYCGLHSIPADVLALSSLTQLDLSNNLIAHLQSDEYNLPNLQELNLLGNQLTTLPSDLFKTTRALKTLCVSQNSITHLPDSITNCTTIEQIYLERNEMTTLPNEIGNLIKLSLLDVSHNHLDQLPTSMSKLTLLQTLELTHNLLTELFNLSNLQYLHELNISTNRLSHLDVSQNHKLSNLYAGYNRIERFELSEQNSLKQLNLSGNRITNLSEKLVNQLTQLSVLFLSDNRLEELPNNLCALPRIRHINLSNNQLQGLNNNETWFTDDLVTSLVSLDLSMNQISDMNKYLSVDKLETYTKNNPKLEIQLYGNQSTLDTYQNRYYCIETSKCGYHHTIGPFRPTMEDAMLIQNHITSGNNHIEIYAVFDGHAGNETSKYAASKLDSIVKTLIQGMDKISKDAAIDIIRTALAQIDEQVKQFTDGSTVALIMIINSSLCIAANIGDARCVLAKKKDNIYQALRVTFDHKPYDRSEANRVYDLGGVVISGRIHGYAVSRSLGDHAARPFITSEPYINAFELKDEDSFVIIACDGVWDVISDQESVDIVANVINNSDDSQQHILMKAAHVLVDMSIANRSRDNISVIILQLNG